MGGRWRGFFKCMNVCCDNELFSPSTLFSYNFYKTEHHTERVHLLYLAFSRKAEMASKVGRRIVICTSGSLMYFMYILVPSYVFAVTCTPACQNGGFCNSSSSSPSCYCPSGFTGSFCQERGICVHATRDLHASNLELNYMFTVWFVLVCSTQLYTCMLEWRNMPR